MHMHLEAACLTIDELLSDDYEPLPAEARNEALAQARLERWRSISADGAAEEFGKRLRRQGLNQSDLLARLGGVRRRPGVPEPSWVADTSRILALLRTRTEGRTNGDIAFGPLLSPVLDAAAGALRPKLPSRLAGRLSSGAFDGMVDHLRRRLSNLVEIPFYEALLAWRRELLAEVRAGDAAAAARLMDATLAPFHEHLLDTGYDELVARMPVLFRLMAGLVRQWQGAYGAFLDRLADDLDDLRSLAPGFAAESPIDRIGWGYSDPHNGGHSVLSIEFLTGQRIFYKPKNLRTDLFVGDLVAKLTELGAPEALAVPRAIARDGYGWTEAVAISACNSIAEVEQYYRRFGGWLAVLHRLSASDMHMENFIASASQPTPVDFEMVLQGLRQRPKTTDASNEADWLASRFLEGSVQSVGMLPAYVQGIDGNLISMGALEASVYPVRVTGWDEMNTPRMLLRSSVDNVTVESNLPILDGRPVGIEAFRAAFLDGFRAMLAFIGEHDDQILAWIRSWGIDDLITRRVIRPTRFYYMLLKRLYDHRRMSDSVAWSLEADFSARLFDWDENAEQPWKLLASERRQLLDLGIPHFTMAAGDNIISDAAGPITRLHVDPAPALLAERFASLGSGALASQSALIEACLQMPAQASAIDATDATTGLAMAQRLRDELVGSAFRAEASLSWLTLNRIDHDVAAQLGLLGHDLYYGAGGIGLFLATLAEAGDTAAAGQARAALAATARAARSSGLGRLVRAIGIGGAVGAGGIAYALAGTGHVFGDAELIDASRTFASAIDDVAIAADERFDVVGGASGAALALVALHRRDPADWILDRATTCGDHLLARRGADGLWVSSDFDGALTGAAHGAAGLAMAFSRLFAATGHDRFRRAAQDCVAFENGHFDIGLGNWRDLRSDERAPNQWCYGAAGIGLSRFAMLGERAVDDETLRDDVERALAAVVPNAPLANDTLCCGISGHVELLALAGRAFGRADLLARASQRAEELSAVWNRTGDFRWNGGSKAFNPGLFQGLAGIGFASLRGEGGTAPSPLLWQ